MILRDRDMTDSGGKVEFTGQGDGTLGERVYYCQNSGGWRADVSALVAYTSGQTVQVEHDKDLSYGTSWGLPAGDLNSDGDYDANDEKDVDSLISTSGYDVRADANLDGLVKAADKTLLSGAKITLGRGFMSGASTFNRRGYAGYENDGVLGDGAVAGSNTRFWHVRHRVMDSTMGRWTMREIARCGGSNKLSYQSERPIVQTSAFGVCMAGPAVPFPEDPGSTVEPWDCAATSTSYNQCYNCCNSSVGRGRSRFSCYKYCNQRYRPGGRPPFLPTPGFGGPCFRESSGHEACRRACESRGQHDVDAIMTSWITPSGERVRVCCLCDVSHLPVTQCDDIADCASARMDCFAFSDPSMTLPCRSVECIGKQVECLRKKLDTVNEACRPRLLSELQFWEHELSKQEGNCENHRKSIN